MVTDIIGGQVDFGVVAVPSVQGHLKSARCAPSGSWGRALPSLAEVPTIQGARLATTYEVEGWFAVIGAAAYFRSEAARYAALVKKANVVLE
jgi:tripartite-type tricarboxylate transporter receptor subunit TctC